MRRRPLRTAALSLVAALGCGTGGGGMDAATNDPLVGTWQGSTHTARGEAITYQITFRADHTMTVDDTITYPAGDPNLAGCTETDQGTGITWTDGTADGSLLLTLDESQGVDSTNVSGCADSSNDETLPPGADSHIIDGSPFSYAIDGAMLTLTPTGSVGGVLVLTRM